MSPNLFIHVPIQQICGFRNVYFFDMSHNVLQDIRGLFGQLHKCMPLLRHVDLSYNSIQSALDADVLDDDEMCTHLEVLQLAFNQIAYVDPAAFRHRSDGSSRFPSLTHLGLANNKIYQIDLLLPLSFPSARFRLELQSNPIGSLVNPLNRSVSDANLVPMTGARSADLSNSELRHMDDASLVQYGLHTALDLRSLLSKLANVDMRQQPQSKFVCACDPARGMYTLQWYASFADTIASMRPPVPSIYQLACANVKDKTVFTYECQVGGKEGRVLVILDF